LMSCVSDSDCGADSWCLADTGLRADKRTISFTPDSWWLPQVITVMAIDDSHDTRSAAEKGGSKGAFATARVFFSAVAQDTRFNQLDRTVNIQIIDNDNAGIETRPCGGSAGVVDEDDVEVTKVRCVTVTLTSKPLADVVVTLKHSKAAQVSGTHVVFAPLFWNQGQDIQLIIGQSAAMQRSKKKLKANEGGHWMLTAISEDSNYNTLSHKLEMPDQDTKSVPCDKHNNAATDMFIFSKSNITVYEDETSGSTWAEYSIRLSQRPQSQVLVRPTSKSGYCAFAPLMLPMFEHQCSTASDCVVGSRRSQHGDVAHACLTDMLVWIEPKRVLQFTTENWKRPQVVRVHAFTNDGMDERHGQWDVSRSVTTGVGHVVSSTDKRFMSDLTETTARELSVDVIDGDSAGLVVNFRQSLSDGAAQSASMDMSVASSENSEDRHVGFERRLGMMDETTVHHDEAVLGLLSGVSEHVGITLASKPQSSVIVTLSFHEKSVAGIVGGNENEDGAVTDDDSVFWEVTMANDPKIGYVQHNSMRLVFHPYDWNKEQSVLVTVNLARSVSSATRHGHMVVTTESLDAFYGPSRFQSSSSRSHITKSRSLSEHSSMLPHLPFKIVRPNGCDVSAWGAWTACSVHCGGGVQHQTRNLTETIEDGCRGFAKVITRPCHALACDGSEQAEDVFTPESEATKYHPQSDDSSIEEHVGGWVSSPTIMGIMLLINVVGVVGVFVVQTRRGAFMPKRLKGKHRRQHFIDEEKVEDTAASRLRGLLDGTKPPSFVRTLSSGAVAPDLSESPRMPRIQRSNSNPRFYHSQESVELTSSNFAGIDASDENCNSGDRDVMWAAESAALFVAASPTLTTVIEQAEQGGYVVVRYDNDETYYRGRVIQHNEDDGTVWVLFDDGDEDEAVDVGAIRISRRSWSSINSESHHVDCSHPPPRSLSRRHSDMGVVHAKSDTLLSYHNRLMRASSNDDSPPGAVDDSQTIAELIGVPLIHASPANGQDGDAHEDNTVSVIVSLHAPQGLGVSLGATSTGQVLVTAFQPVLVSGALTQGPAEESGRVLLGDQLMCVNGQNVVKLSLEELAVLLKQARGNDDKIELALARSGSRIYAGGESIPSRARSSMRRNESLPVPHFPMSSDTSRQRASSGAGEHQQQSKVRTSPPRVLADGSVQVGVIVESPNGELGVELGRNDRNEMIVLGFFSVSGGLDMNGKQVKIGMGPLERSRQVYIGDVIKAVNGMNLDGFTVDQSSRLISDASSCGGPISFEMLRRPCQ
jgi:hypothetical protein